MTVSVFAASSSRVENEYGRDAAMLGTLFAKAGIDVVFGGGGIGLMNKLADAVISNGGKITGVIPAFMKDEGWGHAGISETIITTDMGERKKRMFEMSDAIVALPGGVGTLDELTEAITLKQLSLYKGPIVILNTLGFYDSFLNFIDNMITNNFFRREHKGIWKVVNTPVEVLDALNNNERENAEWRKTAKI